MPCLSNDLTKRFFIWPLGDRLFKIYLGGWHVVRISHVRFFDGTVPSLSGLHWLNQEFVWEVLDVSKISKGVTNLTNREMMCQSLEMIKKQTLDSSCFWYFWLSTKWIPSAKTDQFFCWLTAMGKILTSHHANRLKLKLRSRLRPTQQLGWLGGWIWSYGSSGNHHLKNHMVGKGRSSSKNAKQEEWSGKCFPFWKVQYCKLLEKWQKRSSDPGRSKQNFTVTNEQIFAGRGERNFKWERSAGSHDLGRERQIMMGLGRWWVYEKIDPHAKIRWLDESQCFVAQLFVIWGNGLEDLSQLDIRNLCVVWIRFGWNSPPKLLGLNLVKYVFLPEKNVWFVGCHWMFFLKVNFP